MLRRITIVAVLVLLAACAGGDEEAAPRDDATSGGELIVQAANYDIAAQEPTRFIAGVLTQDQLFVSYGEVEMAFFYLGTEQGEGTAEEGPVTTGEFLAIEGDNQDGPIAAPASSGRGVYSADVTFDRAGFWAVQLSAEIEGETHEGRSVFEVFEEHQLPAIGDKAPFTENRTLESKVPRPAIDSRAQGGEPIPDPELHEMTIEESIQQDEPVVVVFSTPVYCVSRFCGPVTDTIQDLHKEYSDRANFIHVEVWFDFQDNAVNKAAAEWLLLEQDLTEPWAFLLDGNGTITARWDNVFTYDEIAAELEKFPRL